MLTFLEEISGFLTSILKENFKPPVLGDFNISWNSPDHTDIQRIAEMLNTLYLHQLINIAMHKAGNTLDWIIQRAKQNSIQNIMRSDSLSDHCIIEWTMDKRSFKNCTN